jgi:ArsR family transcriptional regulator, cadmium/lead-responsive transcriptional repressor
VQDPGPVFAALADPTRRAVLRAVAAHGTATATELTEEVEVTRQAVAKHLRVLSDAGLVAAERAGKEQRYRVTPAPFTDAVAWMAEVGAAWDARLERLATRTASRA